MRGEGPIPAGRTLAVPATAAVPVVLAAVLALAVLALGGCAGLGGLRKGEEEPASAECVAVDGARPADLVDELVADLYAPPGAPVNPDPGAARRGLGRHETPGGVLPGFETVQDFDWASGATENWANPRFLNVWGHAFLDGPRRQVRLEALVPQVFVRRGDGRWQELAPPDPAEKSWWTSWIAPPFTFVGSPADVRQEPSGGSSIDLSDSNAENHWFQHWAWNQWATRLRIPEDVTAVSVQTYARIVPADDGGDEGGGEGGDDADVDGARVYAGISGDTYDSADDPGGSANPAIGIPRYKRVTSQWRQLGYTTMTRDDLLQDPPPLYRAPGVVAVPIAEGADGGACVG